MENEAHKQLPICRLGTKLIQVDSLPELHETPRVRLRQAEMMKMKMKNKLK